ncbi:M81 family metallopeptidase [Nocardioides luteus]|uniref:M81 family metallopeptidase n=1 Tax=Nocardioides luteus TaxID=1844 RepID=UPI001C43007B|nr:M81 family metallopeptidase [Nocardioides luteus]
MSTGARRPRVGIAGISLEASTFSPALTTTGMLAPKRGQEILDARPFWATGGSLAEAADWVPVMQARGIPGGAIPLDDYLSMKAEIVSGLAAAHAERPLDGIVLDLHGAASAVGLDDLEGDLAVAVREAVGGDVLISTGMDLHGNVSPRLAEALDLLTCYRMAPHEDWLETKERAVRHLLDRLALPAEARKPAKAWAMVPVLLPGEKTSTRLEPAATLYRRVAEVAELDGVVDAAYWVGYPWADEPRNHAVVMVTGDSAEICLRECTALAEEIWKRHEEFEFVAPTASLEEAIGLAVASPLTPYVISDSGDNPTAGGAGDVTWSLARLLEDERLRRSGKRLVYASIPDAGAAEAIARAGVGAHVDVEVGARVDSRLEAPVRLVGEVLAVVETTEGYADTAPGNLETVVRVGCVDVIVTRARRPYHLESDFTTLGISPREVDVLVVKIGYLEPELFEIAADWVLALTRGGVDQDLLRLGHRRIQRPMYPFDTGFTFTPSAVLVPTSGTAR